MLSAECPCCHGTKELEVVCMDMRDCPTIYFPCTHCDDGRVKIAERHFRSALWQHDECDRFATCLL
jgi:hypothetical protein